MRLQKSPVSVSYFGYRRIEDDREFLDFCESLTVSKAVLAVLAQEPDLSSKREAEAYLREGKKNVCPDLGPSVTGSGTSRRVRRGRDAA